jgi:hypothetical protein
VQGGGLIFFLIFEIVRITYEFLKLIIVDHYFHL